MAKTKSCNDYIPEELIFNILSWLPVQALLRFKTVCKSWRSIISDPRFVHAHLANSHKKQAVLLNYWDSRFSPAEKYIQVHDTHHHHQNHRQDDFVKLYLPPHVTGICFINSCDGLICLSNRDGSVIYIWNPSTKRLNLLPAPKKQLSPFYVHIGFGFDSICNDYKLLRIAFMLDGTSECELYSANAASWKHIQIPQRLLQRRNLVAVSKFIYAQSGVLYMVTPPQLLAFDLHNEVFRLYPFPNFELVRSDVLDFEGCVAMIFRGTDGSPFGLYRMDDVCGQVFWTKLFNLEADIEIDWVYRYLGCGQFLAHNYVNSCLYYVDYKKEETKKCLLDLSPGRTSHPVKFTESLVSCFTGSI